MLRIILCFFFCIVFSSTKTAISQSNIYHPFAFNKNPEWRVDSYYPYFCNLLNCGLCYQLTYSINGDTTINSTDYYKLFFKNFTYNTAGYKAAIREDTLQKKVYVLYNCATTEILLYNFNLQTGDTVYFNNGNGQGIVESIDSVLVDTEQHKRINLFYCCWLPISIIEGVGSTTGLLEIFISSFTGFEGVADDLRCFKLNGNSVYQDTLFSCTECDIALGTIDLPGCFDNEEIFCFPNPASLHGWLHLKPKINQNQVLKIYDAFGRLVFQQELSAIHQVFLSEKIFHSGLYYMRVEDEERKTKSQKIIIR